MKKNTEKKREISMSKYLNFVTISSLSINILILLLIVYIVFSKGGVTYVSAKMNAVFGTSDNSFKEYPIYQSRVSLFEELESVNNKSVFVGDSLTQRANWNEIFNNQSAINRGIDSDQTMGVLLRIGQIAEEHPNKIFIMIGINDIIKGIKKENILENYKGIIAAIKDKSPLTEIYIQNILPVNYSKYAYTIDNSYIQTINSSLKDLAENEGINYINLYDSFLLDDELNSAYTFDGLHLSGEGYSVWKYELQKYID